MWYLNSMRMAAVFSFALVLVVSGCGESATGDGGAGGTAGNGGAGGINGNCPIEEPLTVDFPCSGDITCNYGAETCCGETYPSTICSCYGGSFLCGATDACLGVEEFGCGGMGGSGGAGGGGGTAGNGGVGGIGGPGPLIDNTLWVPSAAGDEILGPPPPGAECELRPVKCPEFPWPQGECVDFEPTSTCIAAFVPECLGTFTVLAVRTRMPDDRVPLCNWITLEQPSLRAIRTGDRVEIRSRHSQLTAPVPGEAHIAFVIGDEKVLDYLVTIPSDFEFPDAVWTAPKDYPAGTPLLFHIDNHGQNEYMLIEVNVL